MTELFDQILIPTDGGEAAESAVELGLGMAQIHDARLHALYIVEEQQPIEYGAAITGLDDVIRELEQKGDHVTNEIATRAADLGVETTTAVQKGTPRNDILTYADAHDIGLIVMGTHGRTGVKRALMGSVTETVVRHSDIPVLTVSGESDITE